MLLPLARQTLQNKLNKKLEEQGMMALIIRLCSDNLPRLLQIATVICSDCDQSGHLNKYLYLCAQCVKSEYI
jgi:hypothetical protein